MMMDYIMWRVSLLPGLESSIDRMEANGSGMRDRRRLAHMAIVCKQSHFCDESSRVSDTDLPLNKLRSIVTRLDISCPPLQDLLGVRVPVMQV